MSILYNIVDHKTDILGYWVDNEGKVYTDNIEELNILNELHLEKSLLELYAKGEKCVFVKDNKKAFIFYPSGNVEKLKHRILYFENNINDDYIKILLNQHKGLTVYKKNKGYIIEIWKK